MMCICTHVCMCIYVLMCVNTINVDMCVIYIYAFSPGMLVILPETILCFSRNFNTLYKKEFCHATIIFLYKLSIFIKSITNLHY